MNTIIKLNNLNTIVFKLQVILLIMEGTEKQKVAIIHLAIGTGSQLTHYVVAMEKVAEKHILTKCSKCNTFEVISHLVNDFMMLMH